LEVRVERRRRAAILSVPKTDDPPPSLNPHRININTLIISKIYNKPTVQIFIIFNVAQSHYDSFEKSVIGRRHDEAIY
jgi:hypothetical protein